MAVKYFLPPILRFVANKTYVIDIISLWYPVYKTVGLISFKKNKMKLQHDKTNETTLEPTKDGPSTIKPIKSKTRGSVADRWLTAASSLSPSSIPPKSKENSSMPSLSKQANSKTNEEKNPKFFDFDKEASLLLQYWIVYGFIYSLLRICFLLPFVGSYLSSATATIAVEAVEPIIFSLTSPKSWLAYFALSPLFLMELKLLFFVWLRFLPTPNTSISKNNSFIQQSSPLQILYSHLAPLALSLVQFSSTVDPQKSQSSSISFFASKAVSILDLAVLVKLISESTKQLIITIVSESATMLPACITLFMPSTFTAYGCVYASAIIPAANSVNCEMSINGSSRRRLLRGSPEYDQAKKDRIRFLKYWVVQSLLLLLMDTFLYSFLAWVPLSRHMTLIVWIGLNLPLGGTNIAYQFLEYELVAFGFLKSTDIQDYDVNKTLTVRLFKKLSSSIPVAKDVDASSDTDSNMIEKTHKNDAHAHVMNNVEPSTQSSNAEASNATSKTPSSNTNKNLEKIEETKHLATTSTNNATMEHNSIKQSLNLDENKEIEVIQSNEVSQKTEIKDAATNNVKDIQSESTTNHEK